MLGHGPSRARELVRQALDHRKPEVTADLAEVTGIAALRRPDELNDSALFDGVAGKVWLPKIEPVGLRDLLTLPTTTPAVPGIVGVFTELQDLDLDDDTGLVCELFRKDTLGIYRAGAKRFGFCGMQCFVIGFEIRHGRSTAQQLYLLGLRVAYADARSVCRLETWERGDKDQG